MLIVLVPVHGLTLGRISEDFTFSLTHILDMCVTEIVGLNTKAIAF